ncbi:hypothetical protein BN77_2019 [Rhizobium mesoamericanum STM3625]|uniref:Uncharacterized protein n=1 Tax=Rhizobium mesoamericanum STM3625 TaxID=1211777 RepID=K0PLQ9_9HYPH|nr:hypothetical protein BN77_2019 [Rhizobium mesoamericanum STM3625]
MPVDKAGADGASRLHALLQDATLDLAQHHLVGCMSGHGAGATRRQSSMSPSFAFAS